MTQFVVDELNRAAAGRSGQATLGRRKNATRTHARKSRTHRAREMCTIIYLCNIISYTVGPQPSCCTALQPSAKNIHNIGKCVIYIFFNFFVYKHKNIYHTCIYKGVSHALPYTYLYIITNTLLHYSTSEQYNPINGVAHDSTIQYTKSTFILYILHIICAANV